MQLRVPEDAAETLIPETGERLLKAVCSHSTIRLAEVLIRLERTKKEAAVLREEQKQACEFVRNACIAALKLQAGCQVDGILQASAGLAAKNLSKAQLMKTIDIMERYRVFSGYNVNVGCNGGGLMAELEGIL